MQQNKNKIEITFPRYFAVLAKKERKEKIKEFLLNSFLTLLQIIGVVGMIFMGYAFLLGILNLLNAPMDEDRPRATDYTPYSGWTYE